MGERVSIQYGKKNHWGDGEDWLSAVLKHHWAGPDFPGMAVEYAKSIERGTFSPLDRWEPDVMMVAFIGYLVASGDMALRVVPTPEDCDNSDWGHYIIWLDSDKPEVEHC